MNLMSDIFDQLVFFYIPNGNQKREEFINDLTESFSTEDNQPDFGPFYFNSGEELSKAGL